MVHYLFLFRGNEYFVWNLFGEDEDRVFVVALQLKLGTLAVGLDFSHDFNVKLFEVVQPTHEAR